MNLQTHQGIEEGLKWFLKDKYEQFEEYIVNFLHKDNILIHDEFQLEEFESKVFINWNSINLNLLWMKVYHFTTRANENSALDNIYDLRYMLSNKSDLKDFLSSYNIEFFLKNTLEDSVFQINSVNYNFLDMKTSLNNDLQQIYQKLFIDYEVWGFIRTLDIEDYNHVFPNKPEFISNVASVLSEEMSLLNDWEKKFGNPYVIEFKQPFCSMQIHNRFLQYEKDYLREYYLSTEEFEKSEYEINLKKGLFTFIVHLYLDNISRIGLKKSINNENTYEDILKNIEFNSGYNYYFLQEKFEVEKNFWLSINKGLHVPKDNILKIWSFEEFKKQSRSLNGFLD